jgi:hypothetical protein
MDLIGAALGFLLTIAVFSYLLGDNQFFRLAINLFIGATAGYVFAVLLYNVIIPRLFFPLFLGTLEERILLLLPLVLSILLLFKLSPRTSWLGNVSMAFLVGVGAAVMIGGAVLGTLFTQLGATISSFNPGNGLIVLVGTLATLVYFQFGVRQSGPETPAVQQVLNGVGALGQVFVAIAFGALFAGVYMAALTAFVERVGSLLSFLQIFLPF